MPLEFRWLRMEFASLYSSVVPVLLYMIDPSILLQFEEHLFRPVHKARVRKCAFFLFFSKKSIKQNY